jgi:phospholipase D1/2
MFVDVTSPAWRHRWVVVKDTWIAYIQPSSGKIHAVMLFDQGFEVIRGLVHTQIPHGLIISNLSRLVHDQVKILKSRQ